MSENRVDPTVAGLFLIALVTLMFGIVGIKMFLEAGDAVNLFGFTAAFIPIVGFVLVIFAYMAGKAGNALAVALFAFIAVALFGVLVFAPDFAGTAGYSMGMYILALFFLIFAIVTLMVGAPKLLALLLLLVCLLYLFVGFFYLDGEKPYAMAFGLFGILSFLVSTYLAMALATQKFPVF